MEAEDQTPHDKEERTPYWWLYECGRCRARVLVTRRSVNFGLFKGGPKPQPHRCVPAIVWTAIAQATDARDWAKWSRIVGIVRRAQPEEISAELLTAKEYQRA